MAQSQSQITISEEGAGKFTLTTLQIRVPQLPVAFRNFRLVQLSDLHYGLPTSIEMIEQSIEIANSLKPDFVLLTGDYLHYARNSLSQRFAETVNRSLSPFRHDARGPKEFALALGSALEKLDPKQGILGVYGNHDLLHGVRLFQRYLPAHITWLVNDSVMLQREGQEIQLAGLDDWLEGKPDLQRSLSYERAGFENLNEWQKQAEPRRRLHTANKLRPFFRLLLSHNPDVVLDANAKLLQDIDLVLCGHTHGGQICAPGSKPILTCTKQRAHTTGLSSFNSTPVYVNRGIGYCGLSIRLFCPPEITVIDFV